MTTLKIGQQFQTQTINSNEKNNKGKKFMQRAQDVGAVATAGIGFLGVEYVFKKIKLGVNKEFSSNLMMSSDIMSKETAEMLFKNSGLSEKGVSLIDFSNKQNSVSALADFLSKFDQLKTQKKGLKKMLGAFKNLRNEILDNIIMSGSNAAYIPSDKKIKINLEKLGAALPHEMGHAKNCNSYGLGRVLFNSRYLSLLTLPIALIALFRKPSDKREESTTAVGKTLDFVKDNSVGLTAACVAPTALEEGLASIKASKLSKEFLSPDKLKALNKFNFTAWKGYAVGGIATITAVCVANIIKNLLSADDTPEKKSSEIYC